jgi:hypothetical protein
MASYSFSYYSASSSLLSMSSTRWSIRSIGPLALSASSAASQQHNWECKADCRILVLSRSVTTARVQENLFRLEQLVLLGRSAKKWWLFTWIVEYLYPAHRKCSACNIQQSVTGIPVNLYDKKLGAYETFSRFDPWDIPNTSWSNNVW